MTYAITNCSGRLAEHLLQTHLGPATIIFDSDDGQQEVLAKMRELGVDFCADSDIFGAPGTLGNFVATLFSSYLNDIFRLQSPDFGSLDEQLDSDEGIHIAKFNRQKLFDSFSKTLVQAVLEFTDAVFDNQRTSLSPLFDLFAKLQTGDSANKVAYISLAAQKSYESLSRVAQRISKDALQEIRTSLRDAGVQLDRNCKKLFSPFASIPERDN